MLSRSSDRIVVVGVVVVVVIAIFIIIIVVKLTPKFFCIKIDLSVNKFAIVLF